MHAVQRGREGELRGDQGGANRRLVGRRAGRRAVAGKVVSGAIVASSCMVTVGSQYDQVNRFLPKKTRPETTLTAAGRAVREVRRRRRHFGRQLLRRHAHQRRLGTHCGNVHQRVNQLKHNVTRSQQNLVSNRLLRQ